MDGSTLFSAKPRASAIEALRRQAELPPEAADTASEEAIQPWPDEDAEYQAAARNAAHPLQTLFFLKGGLPTGFAYANMERVFMRDSGKPGHGPVLVARFAGSVVTEVVIEGRHLKSICNDIGRRVCPWLWELPAQRDFRDPNKPCITKIDFQDK